MGQIWEALWLLAEASSAPVSFPSPQRTTLEQSAQNMFSAKEHGEGL